MLFMYYAMRKKTILKAACATIFAVMLCAGCYDLGLEPSVPPPMEGTFVDRRDGHVYKKVQIGRQIWMAENLSYEADGSVCPYVQNYFTSVDPDYYCAVYGRLYDWSTAMNGENRSNANPSGVEGICPVGWHLPSDAEWSELIGYVGINASVKLRAVNFGETGRPGGRDIYGFSALAGGLASELSTNFFTNIGDAPPYFWDATRTGYWWSSTEEESNGTKAWGRVLTTGNTEVYTMEYDKHYMFSVRCVHDY